MLRNLRKIDTDGFPLCRFEELLRAAATGCPHVEHTRFLGSMRNRQNEQKIKFIFDLLEVERIPEQGVVNV